MIRWPLMQLSDIFLQLGETEFASLLRAISFGKLKTYKLYDRMKIRLHLAKLNSESMKKSAPRFWTRLSEHDEEFASDLSQAILVSHMEMIKAVVDELGIPNQDGFFDKDLEGAKYLTGDWQTRVYEKFKDIHPRPVLLFYLNHLGWELLKSEEVFQVPA
jgi:hypothetical protein